MRSGLSRFCTATPPAFSNLPKHQNLSSCQRHDRCSVTSRFKPQRTKRDRMTKKRTVKVIKRQESNAQEHQREAEPDGGSNIWSKSVRLWDDQYREAAAKRPP